MPIPRSTTSHKRFPKRFLVLLGLCLLTGCTSQRSKDKVLLDAAYSGSTTRVKEALGSGANVKALGEHGGSALLEAAAKGNLVMATVLLNHHATVNQAMETGHTPLHLAAFYGHADMVALLLARGANRQAQTKRGRTPLDEARAARRLPAQRNDPNFIKTTALLEAPTVP